MQNSVKISPNVYSMHISKYDVRDMSMLISKENLDDVICLAVALFHTHKKKKEK